MDKQEFPKVGDIMILHNAEKNATFAALVMRAEEARKFIIVLDEDTFETHKFDMVLK